LFLKFFEWIAATDCDAPHNKAQRIHISKL
jgi:hypothetical protein